jgi:hypothetical protein
MPIKTQNFVKKNLGIGFYMNSFKEKVQGSSENSAVFGIRIMNFVKNSK